MAAVRLAKIKKKESASSPKRLWIFALSKNGNYEKGDPKNKDRPMTGGPQLKAGHSR